MEFRKRTSRRFTEEIHECPLNAGLFSDQVLYGILTEALMPASLADKRAAKAELLVRVFLSSRRYSKNVKDGQFDVLGEITRWLGPDLLRSFVAVSETCGQCLSPKNRMEKAFKLLEESETLGELDAEAIKCAFRPWLQADGVLPVFNVEGSYLLPFSFLDKEGRSEVQDYSGKMIPEWTQHLETLRQDFGVTKSVQVAVHQNEYVSITGNSMMLPVLMAWNRKHVEGSRQLPLYHPLRFLATGAIKGGRLEPVATEEKVVKVNMDVEGGLLIRPGEGAERGMIRLGEPVSEVLERIREYAEVDYDTSSTNAATRLAGLEGAVRRSFQGNWSDMNRRLDRLAQNLDPELDANEYLDSLMLRSASRCHSGMTGEALMLNQEAKRLLKLMPNAESKLFSLEIEELVMLQDEEDFAKIFELAGDLGARLEKYCNTQSPTASQRRKDDLRMRYYGTMGQFEAYATYAGVSGHNAAIAKTYFEKALQCAKAILKCHEDGKDGCIDADTLADCTQDANYLLLWSALFNEQNMQEAYSRAKRFADKLRKVADEKADKNDSFRRRFAALGQYRAVLSGRTIPVIEEESLEAGLTDGNIWVRATIGKYLAAVAASIGDFKSARHYFEDAVLPLTEKDDILGVIHMTILAEAYRSMRGHDNVFAETMRERALAKFETSDAALLKKDAWHMWLESRGDDSDFPGLNYWY